MVISQRIRNLLVFITIIIPSLAMGGRDSLVKDNTEVEKLVNTLFEQLITSWSVSTEGDDPGALYLKSPIRKLENKHNYCIQNVIRIEKDESGKLRPLQDQLLYAKSFFMYSLNKNQVSCEKQKQHELFPVSTENGEGPNINLLNLINNLSKKPWLNSTDKIYHMVYKNKEAELCLMQKDSLGVFDVSELMADNGDPMYRIVFTGCSLNNRKLLIEMDVIESLDRKSIQLNSRSIDKRIAECVRTECYRDY